MMQLIEILSLKLNVKPEKIRYNSILVVHLGMDSLDGVEIVMACEDEYNIKIEDDMAKKIVTVGDLIELLYDEGVKSKYFQKIYDKNGKDIKYQSKPKKKIRAAVSVRLKFDHLEEISSEAFININPNTTGIVKALCTYDNDIHAYTKARVSFNIKKGIHFEALIPLSKLEAPWD